MARRWVFIAISVGLLLAVLMISGWCTAHRMHDDNINSRLISLQPLIEENAQRTGLSVNLIRAVIRAESGGDPKAISKVGAKGLMQIRPLAEQDALKQLRLPENLKGDLFEPKYNLLIGTTYLAHMVQRFEGDIYLGVAAYHMGPTRIAKLKREHPRLNGEQIIERFAGPQTKAYVNRVMNEIQ